MIKMNVDILKHRRFFIYTKHDHIYNYTIIHTIIHAAAIDDDLLLIVIE